MGTSELLRYLEKLEVGLSSFSYETLSTDEAGELKKTFNDFKSGLEDKVFGVPASHQLEVIYDEIGIQSPNTKTDSDSDGVAQKVKALLQRLEATPLNTEQLEILEALKLLTVNKELPNAGLKVAERKLENQNPDRVNLDSLWMECMEQLDLMEELVRLFKQNIFEFIGKTRVNLQSDNLRGVDFACQKIGPSLRMMRCHTLLEITEQMSNVCKSDNDLKHLNFLYKEFLGEYPLVEALMDQKVQKLAGQ